MAGQVTYLTPTDVAHENAMLPAATGPAANAIDQVRELLYGDALRGQGRRLDDVNDAIKALEQRLMQRLADIDATIETVARGLRGEHGASVRAIGAAISDMGRQIASMGDVGDAAGRAKSP